MAIAPHLPPGGGCGHSVWRRRWHKVRDEAQVTGEALVYQKILVAIDASQPAALALDEAIKIAREQRQTSLRILHVVNEGLTLSPDVPSANLGEVDETLRTQGKALLAAAESRARAAGVRAEGVMVEKVGHRSGACIVQQAGEWPADLIVCGTHGRRGITRLVLGSDAEYVVRHASVPVLLLRSAERKGEGRSHPLGQTT